MNSERPRPTRAPRPRRKPAAASERAEVDYRALAEFRHQVRRFTVFSEQQARAAGLEPQQHQLLLAIKGLPEGLRPTISELAQRLALKHHTVVGLVDRLALAGMVERTRNELDQREILLGITVRGQRVLRVLSLAHEAELRSAGPALVRSLNRIVANVSAKVAPPARRKTRG